MEINSLQPEVIIEKNAVDQLTNIMEIIQN